MKQHSSGAFPDSALSIVSYNIRHGLRMDGILDLRAAADVAMALKPDFVGLQEVDMLTRRVGGADTCGIISQATGMNATFAKAIEFDGGEYGVALLSRERPLSVLRTPLPGAEPRVLLLCEFAGCRVGVTHLAVESEEARLASMPILARLASECADKPLFLMGDWNAPPGSPTLSAIREFLEVISDETRATYHGDDADASLNDASGRCIDYSGRCIDYIAIDRRHIGGFKVVESRTVEERLASDHAPQLVRGVFADAGYGD